MPLKATSPPTDLEVVDRFDGGVGWFAHPGETMQRTSHALATDAGVFVVDPVDAPGVDDLLADLGAVAGVVVLMNRHQRDADALATRHGVPVYCPPGVTRSFEAPVERVSDHLPGTSFSVRRAVDVPGWTESALYDGDTLVVGDALGTVSYFTARSETLAVHPMLRLTPPRRLRGLTPGRVLVGHGAGVLEGGTEALRAALDGARSNALAAWTGALRDLL